jgi:hypothetical protein
MRPGRFLSCGVLAAFVGACVGTLDDPTMFQRGTYSPSLTRDAGSSPDEDLEPVEGEDGEDAGQGTSDASGRDTGPMDGAVADAGESWSKDSATPADAGPADAATTDATPAQADASSTPADAGGGCDFRALISAKCGNASCHGALAVSTGLDLVSDGLAGRLAGRMGSLACSNYLLIDPEQPARSALYLKVTAEACGSRMPLGGTLNDKEQACILQWIENLQ